MTDVELIRSSVDEFIRPERSLPDTLVLELIALSVCEFSHNAAPIQIRVVLEGPTHGFIEDSGRGMRMEPDEGDEISHAERALTSIYPIAAGNAQVQQLLTDNIWGPRGSQGPVLANALSSAYVFQSRRNGEVWEQCYRRGVPEDPPCLVGATDRTGTTVRFLVDSSLAPNQTFSETKLTTLLNTLTHQIPNLEITLPRVS